MSFKQEFKDFINQGNVMDMAVGIIIGGAFTAIVDSVVGDLISPIIGMITGGVDFTTLAVTVGDAKLTYGNLIMAIINFLIIALVVFFMVKGVNKVRKPKEEEAAPVATCPFCKEELKEGSTRCPHCAAELPAPAVAE